MLKNFKKAFSLLIKEEKNKSIIFVFFLLTASFLELASFSIIFPIIEILVNKEYTKFDFFLSHFNEEFLVMFLIFAFLILLVLKNIFLMFFYYWQNKFVWKIYERLSISLLTKYLDKDFHFYFSRNSSELIRNIYVEIKNFSSVITSFIKIIVESTLLLGIIIILLYLNFKTTILSILIVTISSTLYLLLFRKFSLRLGETRLISGGKQIKALQEIFGAIKDIKLKNSNKMFSDLYRGFTEKFSKAVYLQGTIMELPKVWLEITFVIILTFSIIFLNYAKISILEIIPTAAIFVAALFRIIPSANRILSSTQNISHNLPSLDKIHTDLLHDIKTKKIFSSNNKNLIFKNSINIKNLNYKYPNTEKYIFKNFSCIINKKQFTLIRGDSGSGKTTLIDLISGLIEPEDGQILCDDESVKNNSFWRKKISYLGQTVFLLDDTIKKNIAFSFDEKEIDNRLMNESLDLSALNDFIKPLKNGLNTVVGEKGIRLSGGQIQRIGIARELYRKSEILIFDESTNALDEETEKGILDCLKEISKSKTVIFISHKKELIKFADNVIDLSL